LPVIVFLSVTPSESRTRARGASHQESTKMKPFAPLLTVFALTTISISALAVGTALGQTRQVSSPVQETQIPVVFSGGYETDPLGRGTPRRSHCRGARSSAAGVPGGVSAGAPGTGGQGTGTGSSATE
jgi:hypothetical protein